MPILRASSSTTPSTPNTTWGTQGARNEFTFGRFDTTS